VGWDAPFSGARAGNTSAIKHFSIDFRMSLGFSFFLDIINLLFSPNTPTLVKVYFYGA
jgi:hypothetical protein